LLNVIDLHSHILPGIDDGASDMAMAVAMARRARALGLCTVIATPHVDGSYDTRAATIKTAADELNQELAHQGVALDVLPGAEIAAHRLADLDAGELNELGLGGGPYLLIEAPLSPVAGDFELFIDGRRTPDRRFVLAHPERSPVLQRDPERLRRLVLDGTLVSITAGSLSGRFGRSVQRFAIELLEEGLVHNVASDMHDLTRRAPGISQHLRTAAEELPGLSGLGDWLTNEVPRAIIAGDPVEVPPTLASAGRRSLSFGRMVGIGRRRRR
jgi:protein-tyrosine phosphatase